MLLFFPLLMILAAPQLDLSLTPQRAPKPALPKIDKGACPFEGCQFGAWTAIENVQLFSSWTEGRKPVAIISEGQKVTAITGVHITLEPSEIEVTAPMPNYGMKPGDVVYGYMNKGEGVFSAWFNGYWVEEFDGSGVAGAGCNRNCSAKLMREGRFEWWVQVKLKDGTTDWTKDADHFEGNDSLSGTEQ